jgi:glycosyltransferase involved in cell wall biosynthesis
MIKNETVIYVNYSPYENSGHILDYLNENFKRVFLFSIAFHPLKGKKVRNRLVCYENGKVFQVKELYYMPVSQSLVWFLIPIRSILNGLQMFKETFYIYEKFGKINYFFSVNAFAVYVGMLLKKMNLVSKTVFWVWDYYPIEHSNKIVKFMRWMYWQFDKWVSSADRVVYLNNRLVSVRKKSGLIPFSGKYPIVPIGTGNAIQLKKKSLKSLKIGFIGVLKKSQGIDMLIDSAEFVNKKFKNITYEIIGSGPDEEYFLNKIKNVEVNFNFYGYVSEVEFKKILSNCTIGIAPYSPEESNLSRYGDPGKVKRYLEFNLPSIITNVFEFSNELKKYRAGIVIEYGNRKQLASAISKIVKNYDLYCKNAIKLHQKYYYKNIYNIMFDINQSKTT